VPAVIARACAWGLGLLQRLGFLPPLLTRLVIGYAFFVTGRGKLQNFENTVTFFTDLGIPMPELNAAFVSRLEYYGGLLLIVGLLTRIVAALLGSTMIVALMTADKETFLKALPGAGEIGLTDVTPVVFGMFLLWLMVSGPGLLSLDALLARRLGLGRAGAPQPGAPKPVDGA
jgi:putative oxidoreductase